MGGHSPSAQQIQLVVLPTTPSTNQIALGQSSHRRSESILSKTRSPSPALDATRISEISTMKSVLPAFLCGGVPRGTLEPLGAAFCGDLHQHELLES
ncbi:hypothetical protein CA13_14930 [Planctomycetes bacterium CA13]|uniref:Uncharacterized protein n=1 Tax=Novipirellula herctigrandis TaxID=2527986 RepID=A0A5C5YYS2_9BACT|nr:hypothetical protein CA13_14930 [Planctomycetes bacterium CA13]